MTDLAAPAAPRPAAWQWPAIIVGLLLLQIALCVVGFLLAARDPSAVVEPDYYTRGLQWNQRAAMQRVQAALGWQAEVAVSPTADALRRRTVTVTLRDGAGLPLADAHVRGKLFAHARALDAVEVPFQPQGHGRYAAPVLIQRGGLWEFRLVVEHDAHVAELVVQQTLDAPGGAP